MKKTNYNAVSALRETLNKLNNLTLESYIMPDEENMYSEDGGYEDDVLNERPEDKFNDEVKQAIVQIRKISIGIIAKLADNPTSESYVFMKRVLDMSDKAMESMNNEGKEVRQSK